VKAKQVILATASVLSLGLALQATSGTPSNQDQKDSNKGVVRVLTKADADKTQDTDVEKHSIAVTNNNGDVTVIVDGKEIPQGQINVEGDGIIILDKDGNVLRNIDITFDWSDKHFGKWNEIASFIQDDWNLEEGVLLSDKNMAFGELAPGEMTFAFAIAGEQPRVMLGVFLDEPGEALRKHLQLENGMATIITEVLEDLPAAVAGLEKYDIIVSVDGLKAASPDAIHKVLSEKDPGDTITLRVIQNGKKKTVDITLGEYDAERMMRLRTFGDFQPDVRGNRWFISPPEFEFEDMEGTVIIPENLHGEVQIFMHPDGIEEVLELPDFDIDIDPEAMHDAIRETIERSKIDLELHQGTVEQLQDGQKRRLQHIMPRIRIKELRDADEHVKKAIELQLQELDLHEMHDGHMKRLHEHLKQLPKVQIDRSLESAKKARERALKHMPEIKLQLDEARNLHEKIQKAAPDLNGEIESVKKRLERLEELLHELLSEIEGGRV